MPNILSGIHLALRSMLAHQQAIEVIEHNVANANTPGYRRQQAHLVTSRPIDSAMYRSAAGYIGQMGTGVMVDRIRRFNMEFFDGRLNKEMGEAGRWELAGGVLKQVELTLGEVGGDGLTAKLDEFWAGWQALSANPTDPALRLDLRDKANALAQGFNGRAKSLLDLRADQDLAVVERVGEVNDLAGQLARLNVEISHVKASGNAPNDLMDERDRLVERLATLTGATAAIQDDGQALVSIGGHALVVGSTSFELQTAPDPANANLAAISWKADGRPLAAPRGEIAGLLEARDRVIPGQLAGLNNLARSLADRVNQVHRAGYNLNNNTAPVDFFEPFTTTDYALEIKLSAAVTADVNNIAAAATPNAPGDGNQAAALSNIQNELLMNGGTTTLNKFYTGQVAALGLELKTANARLNDRRTVIGSLEQLRESVSGVSMDEEAANLVTAQRMFQASARMMTALDEMLDTVINGLGQVGR